MVEFSKKCKPSDPKAPCKFALIDVKVYFQRFPGIQGSDAERGIKDVKFTYESATITDSGKTAADGLVLMKIGAGETKIILKIFATTYEITLVPTIDPVTTLKGIQWRLDMLGYEPGKIDGLAGRKTDFAMLEFEADNAPLDTVGLPNSGTGIPGKADQAQLTTQSGV